MKGEVEEEEEEEEALLLELRAHWGPQVELRWNSASEPLSQSASGFTSHFLPASWRSDPELHWSRI